MKPTLLSFLLPFVLLIMILSIGCTSETTPSQPNIVYILADDLGYGDVSAMNPDAAWQTQNIDKIA